MYTINNMSSSQENVSVQRNGQENNMSSVDKSQWKQAHKNMMQQFRSITRYINKQAKLRAAAMMKAYKAEQRALKKKQDQLYKDIAFMFRKEEAKINRAEQRKLKATRKNMVAVYQPVEYKIVTITNVDSTEQFNEFAITFKTNLSRKLYLINVFQYKQCPQYTSEQNPVILANQQAEEPVDFFAIEENQQDSTDFSDVQPQMSEEEQAAYWIYISELKKYTTTQVCGKRAKQTTFRPLVNGSIQQTPYISQEITSQFRKLLVTILFHEQLTRMNKIKFLTNKLSRYNQGKRIQFMLLKQNGQKVSTRILPYKDAVEELQKLAAKMMEQYGEQNAISKMFVYIYDPFQKVNKKDIVRGGQKIISMRQKYTIISPESDTNCFYHCLVYYNMLLKGQYDQIENQKKIIEQARELKRQFKNEKDFSDLTDIARVADYYGCEFKIYDNLFRKLKNDSHIKGRKVSNERKSSKLINASLKLQFVKNHCCLMLPNNQFPDFVKQYQNKQQTVINDQCTPLIPKKPFKKDVSREIWSYDLEAYKMTKKCGTQIPFAIGICNQFNTQNFEYQYQSFYGSTCIQEFFDFLSNYNVERKQNSKGKDITHQVFLYAHNGAKYDLAIINQVLLKRSDLEIVRESFTELNGGVISQTIINQHGIHFTFRDSARIFAGSLDGLCKDLKPKYMKLSGHKFKFDDLNAENINQPSIRAEIEEYLKHDCLSLAQIMIEFRKELINDPKIEIDICDCYTSATLAKKLYFNKYYFKKCGYWKNEKWVKDYIYELSKELDLDIRRSYFGGRCDIYKYGAFKGKFYYYDFTSLYPYVGAEQYYPIGKPVRIEGKDIDLKSFFGFVQFKVTTNKNAIPLHGHKFDSKLTFANHENSQMMLFSEEIKRGIKIGNTYEFIYGYSFNKSKLLQDIMSEGFKLKALNKAEGKSVMEKTWKIVINSAYGFFGLRWQNKRGLRFMCSEELDAELAQGHVYNYNQIGEDEYMVDQENDLFDIKGKSIPIASAVTSYARMCLYDFMEAIKKLGHTIYYTDTDSVITDCNIKQYKELMERFQWDGCGNELGSVKNECDDKAKKYLNKEEFVKQLEQDGGELYFDQVQILGPKEYSLRKTLINGKIIEIAKLKGVKDSSFEEQTKLLEGQKITKDVLQFISGKNAYMKDQDIDGRVYVKNITKSLCQYNKKTGNLKYSKGYIVGQDVKPFLFIDGVLQQ